jgi:hypothetical protein
MNTTSLLAAVGAVNDLLTIATAFAAQAQRISVMINAAQAAGRDLTESDWAAIHAQQAAARAALAQALGDA